MWMPELKRFRRPEWARPPGLDPEFLLTGKKGLCNIWIHHFHQQEEVPPHVVDELCARSDCRTQTVPVAAFSRGATDQKTHGSDRKRQINISFVFSFINTFKLLN